MAVYDLMDLAPASMQARVTCSLRPRPALTSPRCCAVPPDIGHPSLGTPIINSDPAALHEAPSTQQVINTAELRDYLASQGAWALPPTPAAASAPAPAGSAIRPSTPSLLGPPAQQTPQSNKALGEVVAELAKLSQKLAPKLAAMQQQRQQQEQEAPTQDGPVSEDKGSSSVLLEGDETAADVTASEPVVSAAEAASGTGAAPGAEIIHTIPLKLAVVSPYVPFCIVRVTIWVSSLAATRAAVPPYMRNCSPVYQWLNSVCEYHTPPSYTYLQLHQNHTVLNQCATFCLQVGSPFSGKSTVAHTLAQAFGLKLLSPQQLVAEAVSAAAAWQQQQHKEQQHFEAEAAVAPSEPGSTAVQPAQADTEPRALVQLGLQAGALLQAGQPVSDDVLVQLLLLGMQQAKTYTPAPFEPAQPESPAKGGKAPAIKAAGANKSDAGAAGARHGTSSGGAAPGGHGHGALGVAAAMAAGLGSAAPGPALPPNLAAGVPGRGFVMDGFPATEAQAMLLEKALTGLDLAAEQELLQGVSLITPPPAAKLPQLQRPLVSGLDAVILLDCADETLAIQRVLGRRLDPVTGRGNSVS